MPKKDRCVKIDSNKVKGLLVGINYRGTSSELGGCINDVKAIEKLIKNTYPNAELEIMTDDTFEKPTRDNILKKLKNLVEKSSAGDLLIFDYSGHGSQVPDIHGDESDGLDETICPIDFMNRRTITYKGRRYVVDSQITNDEINEIITNVPKGAKFLMLSDSCHSGTIGDLKNDFLRYEGPTEWPNKADAEFLAPIDHSTSSTMTATKPTVITNSAIKPMGLNLSAAPEITCKASWIYLESNGKPQIWLIPQNYEIYKKFNHKKHIIHPKSNEVPALLKRNRNLPYSAKTIFQEVAPNIFSVTCVELGISALRVDLSHLNMKAVAENNRDRSTSIVLSSCNSSFNSQISCTPSLIQLPNGEQIVTSCNVNTHYDPETGEHEHVNYSTGEKNKFTMRSHNCCKGGELRIISGCQENQTSADTGRNGACTLAFLNTAGNLGGLEKLLLKVFSHNVQDLRFVQDHINSYLMKYGFSQQSMVSWDHSTSTRAIENDPALSVLNQFNNLKVSSSFIGVSGNLCSQADPESDTFKSNIVEQPKYSMS